MNELEQVEDTLVKIFDLTIKSIKHRDMESIQQVVELEDKMDYLSETFQNNHIKRLNEGSCNVDAGVIFIDMVGNLERIADHMYKIAMFTKDELFGEKRKYDPRGQNIRKN